MSVIRFKAKPFKIGAWTVLRLPDSASAKLPSRGMTFVEGNLNGSPLRAALEPDGKGSHWFKIDDDLLKSSGAAAGSVVTLEIEPTKDWLRPAVPEDLAKALAKIPEAQALWMKITPNSQWDWVRWIRSTKQPQTRQRRIEVACSKLKKGMRRPCCFNRNLCTEAYVSKNWVLIEPAQATR